MRYEVLRVEHGNYTARTLYAIHGCPDMPRARYADGAGTLERLTVGEVHRLSLRPPRPSDPNAMNSYPDQTTPRFWTECAEAASP